MANPLRKPGRNPLGELSPQVPEVLPKDISLTETRSKLVK